MLVIHPDECIDCGVCEPECPVNAIKPDTEPSLDRWLDINRQVHGTDLDAIHVLALDADFSDDVQGKRLPENLLLAHGQRPTP
jgi:ferredoxin